MGVLIKFPGDWPESTKLDSQPVSKSRRAARATGLSRIEVKWPVVIDGIPGKLRAGPKTRLIWLL
jgi:hypothetical protein